MSWINPWGGGEAAGLSWDRVWDVWSLFPELSTVFIPIFPDKSKVEDIVQEVYDAYRTNHHSSQ